jgi:hypothetical protein
MEIAVFGISPSSILRMALLLIRAKGNKSSLVEDTSYMKLRNVSLISLCRLQRTSDFDKTINLPLGSLTKGFNSRDRNHSKGFGY